MARESVHVTTNAMFRFRVATSLLARGRSENSELIQPLDMLPRDLPTRPCIAAIARRRSEPASSVMTKKSRSRPVALCVWSTSSTSSPRTSMSFRFQSGGAAGTPYLFVSTSFTIPLTYSSTPRSHHRSVLPKPNISIRTPRYSFGCHEPHEKYCASNVTTCPSPQPASTHFGVRFSAAALQPRSSRSRSCASPSPGIIVTVSHWANLRPFQGDLFGFSRRSGQSCRRYRRRQSGPVTVLVLPRALRTVFSEERESNYVAFTNTSST